MLSKIHYYNVFHPGRRPRWKVNERIPKSFLGKLAGGVLPVLMHPLHTKRLFQKGTDRNFSPPLDRRAHRRFLGEVIRTLRQYPAVALFQENDERCESRTLKWLEQNRIKSEILWFRTATDDPWPISPVDLAPLRAKLFDKLGETGNEIVAAIILGQPASKAEEVLTADLAGRIHPCANGDLMMVVIKPLENKRISYTFNRLFEEFWQENFARYLLDNGLTGLEVFGELMFMRQFGQRQCYWGCVNGFGRGMNQFIKTRIISPLSFPGNDYVL
jgi:hypothetical protein